MHDVDMEAPVELFDDRKRRRQIPGQEIRGGAIGDGDSSTAVASRAAVTA